jgi:O-antigen/teichoic acid export membrane protein
LDYAGSTEFISMLGLIVAIDAFCSVPFAKLRKQERSIKFSILKIINVLSTIVLVVFFYEFLPLLIQRVPLGMFIHIRMDVSFVLVANLIASALILVLLIPEIIEDSWKVDFTLLKEILKYSFPLLIAGLAGTVTETLDRVMLKHLISDKDTALYALGIYGANYKIAMLLVIFIQMFRYAAEPFYFNYYGKPDDKKVYAQRMRLFIGVVVFLALLILLFLDYFKYFISVKYHEGLFIVPFILVSYIFYGIFLNLSIWYKLTKQTMYGAIITVVGALITIYINFSYVPQYSYVASAYGHVIVYFVMMLISYYFGQKYYYIEYNLKRIAEYILVACVIFVTFEYFIPVENYLIDALKLVVLFSYVVYILIRENLFKLNQLYIWRLK